MHLLQIPPHNARVSSEELLKNLQYQQCANTTLAYPEFKRSVGLNIRRQRSNMWGKKSFCINTENTEFKLTKWAAAGSTHWCQLVHSQTKQTCWRTAATTPAAAHPEPRASPQLGAAPERPRCPGAGRAGQGKARGSRARTPCAAERAALTGN